MYRVQKLVPKQNCTPYQTKPGIKILLKIIPRVFGAGGENTTYHGTTVGGNVGTVLSSYIHPNTPYISAQSRMYTSSGLAGTILSVWTLNISIKRIPGIVFPVRVVQGAELRWR